ncbi:MAG: DNA-processing protein DprA [Alphaproteobacteria bacterium]
MTNLELMDWLRLSLSENVGPATFRQLLAYFGSAKEALQHLPELASRGGKREIKIASEKQVESQLKRAEKVGATLLTWKEADYPFLLKQIKDAPPVLFVLGHTGLLAQDSVAIVGTRNASLNGKNIARFLAAGLIENHYSVISGMAKGIDAAAHAGVLDSGIVNDFGTVAVLGTPVDEAYPLENKDLYEQIKERGCLVSELAFGTPLVPQNFPRRNRIISGLSKGVVVIEAQVKSGSLITAREAANQGREVFAVPGFPMDPRSAGPNALIQEGATLVQSAKDIVDVLKKEKTFYLEETLAPQEYQLDFHSIESNLETVRQKVVENLSAEPVEVDSLVRASNATMQEVNVVLVELELAGRLERHPGNRVSLIYGG